MKRAVSCFVFAVLGQVCQLPAQNAQANSIRQAMLGNWKLVSYTREELPSGAKSNVMGEHPSGYINFGPDGRMMVMIAGSGRKKPTGAIATPEEAKALITSMLAYGGTYTIDSAAGTVTYHIDISWDQARTGADYVRSYKLEDNRLVLSTPAENDPATGQKTVRTLTWER